GLVGGMDGIFYGFRRRRAVSDDGQAVGAEQRGATDFRRVAAGTEGGERTSDQKARELITPAGVEDRTQLPLQEVGKPFHGLEGDVAGKPVGNNHINLATVQVTSFDITDVVEGELFQYFMRGTRRVGPFGVILAVAEYAHARRGHPTNHPGIHFSPDGELHKVERLTLD